jgi:hypothetical protein
MLGWLSWLMVGITLDYVPPRHDAGFLQIKEDYWPIFHWKAAFWVHVFTSLPVLLAGFTQFFDAFRSRGGWWIGRVHQWMGRSYGVLVCFISGPASLIMAFYANGGMSSRLAFTLLALGWMATTAMGWRTALSRHWRAHREWMIRSYALTLSALTLRAWKWALVGAFDLRPMDAYRLVAWLGFVPNFLIAEWLIRRSGRQAVPLLVTLGLYFCSHLAHSIG